MASVDLKEAFYSIRISEMDRKYFHFYWSWQKIPIYFFDHGLSSSPWCFAKILKTVYTMFCRNGHIPTAYIDDSCLQGRTKQQCAKNVSDTINLLDNLVFTVHDKKSILMPTKEITLIGFVLNSVDMTVRLLLESLFQNCA